MAAISRFIDVSSFQGAQDWAALARGGLTGAMVKATEGQHTHDPHYRMHMDGLTGAGVLPSAYHFGHPNQDAHAEAANYVGVVKADADRHAGFVHWLDLERETSGENYAGVSAAGIRAWAEAWIDRVKAAFPHQRVGCYTSAADIAAGHYPRNSDALWYPAYPAGLLSYTQAEQRTRPVIGGIRALFWQFTSTPIDRSICYMTPAAFKAWAGVPTVREDDMPSPVDLWAYKGELNGKTDPNDAYAYLRGTNSRVAALGAKLDALTGTVNAMSQTITTLAAAKGGDSKAVADAITALAKSLDAIAAAHADDGGDAAPTQS